MRICRLIIEEKTQESDSGWRSDDLQPRHSPVFTRTRPIRAGWRWRSARAVAGERQFVLVVLCHPGRNNWQAMLILCTESGGSLVGRYEYHGNHPGLHAHAHCWRGGNEIGPGSVDNLLRVPSSGVPHRRRFAWTENSFWEAARRFFRVKEGKGPLL